MAENTAITKHPQGRKCASCSHKNAKEIDKQILKGVSLRNISQHFGMDVASVSRHAQNCLEIDLQAFLAKAQEQGKVDAVVDVYNELLELLAYTKKLKRASENALADPETGEITLEPRAWEVDVIYTIVKQNGDNTSYTKKKEKLHQIINRLEGDLGMNVHTEVKMTDIRDFALKTIDRCDVVIDKFAKIQGVYTKEKENPQTVSRLEKALQQYSTAIRDYTGKTREHAKQIILNTLAEKLNLNIDELTRAVDEVEVAGEVVE